MTAPSILAIVPLIYIILFVIVAGVMILKVRKWIREEPINKRKEELTRAILQKQMLTQMALDVKKAMNDNPSMSPSEIANFIQGYNCDNLHDMLQTIAKQKEEDIID